MAHNLVESEIGSLIVGQAVVDEIAGTTGDSTRPWAVGISGTHPQASMCSQLRISQKILNRLHISDINIIIPQPRHLGRQRIFALSNHNQ